MLTPSALASAMKYNAGSKTGGVTGADLTALGIHGGYTAGSFSEAVAAFQSTNGLGVDGKLGPKTLAALRAKAAQAPAIITEFGAWVGTTSIANPAKMVKAAKAAGLDLLDFMLNDATDPAGKPLKLARAAYIEAAKRARGEGLRVSLTTWVKPTSAWVAGLRDHVGPLAAQVAPEELVQDAEEPWTNWTTPAGADKWDDLTIGAIRDGGYAGPLGVSFIVYANRDEVGPLITDSDGAGPDKGSSIVVPQPYITEDQNVPGLIDTAFKRCRPFGKEQITGLAAYSKPYGVVGIGQEFKAVARNGGKRVRLWSLASCGTVMAAAIRQYRDGA